MILTIIGGVVWRALGNGRSNSNSAKDLIFEIIANFLGQSMPLRQNRRIMTTLRLLFILMTFIMGSSYQSLIISSMTWSREGIRLKTFEDFYESKFQFTADKDFVSVLNNSGDFSLFLKRLRMATPDSSYKALAELGVASVESCLMASTLINSESRLKSEAMIFYFYILPDVKMKYFEKLSIANHSPFYERFQRYHDRIFESGIRQFLRYQLRFVKLSKNYHEETFMEKEGYLLNIDDISGSFYILLFGNLAAALSFLLEVAVEKIKNSRLLNQIKCFVTRA